jgi:hypothetical protein
VNEESEAYQKKYMSAQVNESGFIWGVPETFEDFPPPDSGFDCVAQNDWWTTAYRRETGERHLLQVLPHAWRFVPIVKTVGSETTLNWEKVYTLMRPGRYVLWCTRCNRTGLDIGDGHGCVWKKRHRNGEYKVPEGKTLVAVESCPKCNPAIEQKAKNNNEHN